jgi:hypothetical protein
VTGDERRTARLLLDDGVARAGPPGGPAVKRAARARRVPPEPVRLAEAMALKTGVLSLHRNLLRPLAAARREALGEAVASQPPRVLVRVDEFPHAQAWDEPERYGNAAFRRFHQVLRDAGVPYLLAVLARPCHAYLDPSATGDRALTDEERALIAEVTAEGAEPAAHGFTHRTRDPRPNRRSELVGLDEGALARLLERADAELGAAGLRPRIFVPPFNRFGAEQLEVLAKFFDVVCGGPESVPLLGFLRGPAWRGDTIYFPSYPPLYDHAGPMRKGLEQVTRNAAGAWLQLTLHFGWEADEGCAALARLAGAVAPYARPWSEFLSAVDASRSA